MSGGWEEGKIKACGELPFFLSIAPPPIFFFHWWLLTGASAEERGTYL